MASTPIYSWPTPDNTDLVKNGALAIRTLGNAIDTTTATLVPKSLVDAKGDLVTATANDTPARIGVGANFAFLQADSAQATGLLWDNLAYTTYTPTVTAGSGSFTTVSASGRYKRIGRLVSVQINVVITTNGTAAGSLSATLPFTGVSLDFTGVFRETNVTGTVGYIVANGANATFLSFASGYPGGTGYGLKGSVTYEVA